MCVSGYIIPFYFRRGDAPIFFAMALRKRYGFSVGCRDSKIMQTSSMPDTSLLMCQPFPVATNYYPYYRYIRSANGECVYIACHRDKSIAACIIPELPVNRSEWWFLEIGTILENRVSTAPLTPRVNVSSAKLVITEIRTDSISTRELCNDIAARHRIVSNPRYRGAERGLA